MDNKSKDTTGTFASFFLKPVRLIQEKRAERLAEETAYNEEIRALAESARGRLSVSAKPAVNQPATAAKTIATPGVPVTPKAASVTTPMVNSAQPEVKKSGMDMLESVFDQNHTFEDNMTIIATLISLLGDEARPETPCLLNEMGISKEAIETIIQALFSKMQQRPVTLRELRNYMSNTDFIPNKIFKEILLLETPTISETTIVEKALRLNKEMLRLPLLIKFFSNREGEFNDELIHNIKAAIDSAKTDPSQNLADLAAKYHLPLNQVTPDKQECFELAIAQEMIKETKGIKPVTEPVPGTSAQTAEKKPVNIQEIIKRPEVAPVIKALKRFEYATRVNADVYEKDLRAKFNDLPQIDLWEDVTEKCDSIFLVIETKMGADKLATPIDIANIVAEEFNLQNDEGGLIAKLNEIKDALLAEYPDAIK